MRYRVASLWDKASPTGVLTLRVRCREGEVRYESGASPTEYTYTGQYSYTADFGLMFYNARWYDASLGRFAQADTIIPESQGVQAWDRYAYVNNNPLRYTDPSGHYCIQCLVLIGVGVIVATAYIYSTPQMQELGQQAAAGLENVVEMAKKKNRTGIPTKILHRQEDFDKQVQENNSGKNKFPSNCKGIEQICFVVAVAGVTVLTLISVTNGGCGQDESLCKIPSETITPLHPSSTPTNTPTYTPTYTPTPTNTPTYTPTYTPTPTSTPAYAPIPSNIFNQLVPY